MLNRITQSLISLFGNQQFTQLFTVPNPIKKIFNYTQESLHAAFSTMNPQTKASIKRFSPVAIVALVLARIFYLHFRKPKSPLKELPPSSKHLTACDIKPTPSTSSTSNNPSSPLTPSTSPTTTPQPSASPLPTIPLAVSQTSGTLSSHETLNTSSTSNNPSSPLTPSTSPTTTPQPSAFPLPTIPLALSQTSGTLSSHGTLNTSSTSTTASSPLNPPASSTTTPQPSASPLPITIPSVLQQLSVTVSSQITPSASLTSTTPTSTTAPSPLTPFASPITTPLFSPQHSATVSSQATPSASSTPNNPFSNQSPQSAQDPQPTIQGTPSLSTAQQPSMDMQILKDSSGLAFETSNSQNSLSPQSTTSSFIPLNETSASSVGTFSAVEKKQTTPAPFTEPSSPLNELENQQMDPLPSSGFNNHTETTTPSHANQSQSSAVDELSSNLSPQTSQDFQPTIQGTLPLSSASQSSTHTTAVTNNIFPKRAELLEVNQSLLTSVKTTIVTNGLEAFPHTSSLESEESDSNNSSLFVNPASVSKTPLVRASSIPQHETKNLLEQLRAKRKSLENLVIKEEKEQLLTKEQSTGFWPSWETFRTVTFTGMSILALSGAAFSAAKRSSRNSTTNRQRQSDSSSTLASRELSHSQLALTQQKDPKQRRPSFVQQQAAKLQQQIDKGSIFINRGSDSSRTGHNDGAVSFSVKN